MDDTYATETVSKPSDIGSYGDEQFSEYSDISFNGDDQISEDRFKNNSGEIQYIDPSPPLIQETFPSFPTSDANYNDPGNFDTRKRTEGNDKAITSPDPGIP